MKPVFVNANLAKFLDEDYWTKGFDYLIGYLMDEFDSKVKYDGIKYDGIKYDTVEEEDKYIYSFIVPGIDAKDIAISYKEDDNKKLVVELLSDSIYSKKNKIPDQSEGQY